MKHRILAALVAVACSCRPRLPRRWRPPRGRRRRATCTAARSRRSASVARRREQADGRRRCAARSSRPTRRSSGAIRPAATATTRCGRPANLALLAYERFGDEARSARPRVRLFDAAARRSTRAASSSRATTLTARAVCDCRRRQRVETDVRRRRHRCARRRLRRPTHRDSRDADADRASGDGHRSGTSTAPSLPDGVRLTHRARRRGRVSTRKRSRTRGACSST